MRLYAETLLLVDDEEILYRSGTHRHVHSLKKFHDNPVLTPDNPERPWEKSIQWVSVYRDPESKKLQMWYQAYSGKGAEDKRFKSVVAYAESFDGIHWEKPRLTLFPYHTRGFQVDQTNIVLIGAADGYGDRYANSVIVDPNAVDPSQKYKMAYYDWQGGPGARGGAGVCVAFSPDGIHWTPSDQNVVLPTSFGSKTMQPPFEDEDPYLHVKSPVQAPSKASDPSLSAQPLRPSSASGSGVGGAREWRHWRYPISMSDAVDALWDPRIRRYVMYGKMWIGGPDGGMSWKHGMGRTESLDFIHWSRPELVAYPDEYDPANIEFHTSPVFIRHGIYFSLNQLYTRENSTIDTEWMTSRDGKNWSRSRQPALVRGGKKYFDAAFLLTNANPIAMGDEIWFYYGGNRGIVRFPNPDEPNLSPRAAEFASGVGLATIRRDRFMGIAPDPKASLRNWNPNDPNRKPEPPANTIGQVTFKPRDLSRFLGLTLNADASKGSIRVEVLSDEGYRLRGFTRDDALPIQGDELEHRVAWKEKSWKDLPAGKYLLRIHLDNAELFAATLVDSKSE